MPTTESSTPSTAWVGTAAAQAGLDAVDLTLLSELSRNGRISNAELAARAGIAESTCLKRVRALQTKGVIVGFHAEISPAALGLHLEALITIRLHAHARGDLRTFQTSLEQLPATQRVYFLAGDRDFMVHVAVPDAGALRELVSDTLSLRPEVASTSTSLIFAQAAGPRGL